MSVQVREIGEAKKEVMVIENRDFRNFYWTCISFRFETMALLRGPLGCASTSNED